MPERIQRKRTKGWKMPRNAVYVGRPTIFGNPVVVNERCTAKNAARQYRKMLRVSQPALAKMIVHEDHSPAVLAGIGMILWREKLRASLPKLRGKNLACWCPLDQPCHADVLLELANPNRQGESRWDSRHL